MSDGIEELRELVKAEPENSKALIDLGVALAETKAFGEAAQALERAVALDPNSALAHYNLGVLYGRCLIDDLAVDEYWEDHTDEDLLFENAANHFQEALKIDETMTAALNNLARINAAMHNVDRARELFTQSLGIDASQDDVREDLAGLGEVEG